MTSPLSESIDTRCHECGVEEGKLHDPGCQGERCPVCSKRIVNCICYYHFKTGNAACPFCKRIIENCACSFGVIFEYMERTIGQLESAASDPRSLIFRLERMDRDKDKYVMMLDVDHYSDKGWTDFLDARGRVPHVFEPGLCFRCGKVNPRMFMVPDDDWRETIPRHLRSSMACKGCYDAIRASLGLPVQEKFKWLC